MTPQIALAKIDFYKSRCAELLSIYKRGQQPPSEKLLSEEELKALDESLSDCATALLACPVIPESTWMSPVKYAYRHGYTKSPTSWLEELYRGLELSQTFFSSFLNHAPMQVKSAERPQELSFWSKHWQWIIGTIVAVAGVIATVIAAG